MSSKSELKKWVKDALRQHGGSAILLDVAKHIWANHELDLRAAGDLFYTWQYDMRWACTELRKDGDLEEPVKRGVWKLVSGH
ncbi:hypothetical protein [Ottowia testudinis]|uniref:Uncharacterized protein n=1 Tax=Ottowia testudinis TaxID=2816950 RepID=A0A975CKR7_9BURK|nr:hypothetical protein [Ottowia testudinis]QTD46886.1 hypothetical protein J1M35_08455 [Ottowia testudinis]